MAWGESFSLGGNLGSRLAVVAKNKKVRGLEFPLNTTLSLFSGLQCVCWFFVLSVYHCPFRRRDMPLSP